ncbi:unnamed protein product [Discula destructiva]
MPAAQIHPASLTTLEDAITARHSTRAYLSTPVPPSTLHRALHLATQAPSNSNVQPWRLWVLTGQPLANVKSELMKHASAGEEPNIPPLPAWAAPYRSHVGSLIFGEGMGIAREDTQGRRRAVLRNFEFFGAPVGCLVTMKADLDKADSLSVGMYLQTLVLALAAEGVSTCVQVSIAGYAEVVKEVVGIPEDYVVICGMAAGFEDPEAKVNRMRPDRLGWEETTVILAD